MTLVAMRDRIAALLLAGVSLPDGSPLVLNETLLTRFQAQPDQNVFVAVLFDGLTGTRDLAHARPTATRFAVSVFGRVMDDLLNTADMCANALMQAGEFGVEVESVFPTDGDLAQIEIVVTRDE